MSPGSLTQKGPYRTVFSTPSRRRRGLISASVLALTAAPLAVLTAAPAQAAPVTVTILGTNDFHGRLLPDRDIPGAAEYAGAVEQLRSENPNTLFAAAGDLIGATTFESFIQDDKPTIDVLNEMQLDVSAVGNHELDKGYDDLVNRVMVPESEANPRGGAEWQYVAANIDEPAGADLIPPSYTQDVAGVTVGFVGAVTEDLPSLVSPDGIEGLTVTDIVDATNAEADRLVAEEGADLVVMLVHEGAPATDCTTMADPDTAFGAIVNGVDDDVDAIISGHTHLAYNCTLPKPTAGTRPVVSAGQYGANLNKLDFVVDDVTGEVSGITQSLINLNTAVYEPDAEVAAIVETARIEGDELGAVELGEIGGAFKRAERPAPTTENPDAVAENRGGESTLGNEVAEVQRWATDTQIAFMNPGGLRADMVGNPVDPDAEEPVFDYPTELTYKQAAVVQPFANTLITMDMTGAQLKTLLEQQWQPGQSRPFLKLGVSDGFEYTYDPAAAQGERIDRIMLDGQEVAADQTYSVTANSFIASGGDNFAAFTQATNKRDSGQVDLEAMVDYMEEFASSSPLRPDFAQRAVGVDWPEDAPASYGTGDTVSVDLSSLAMTGPGDVQDQALRILFAGKRIGSTPVDNTVADNQAFDESGTASVEVVLPRYAGNPSQITFVGRRTGTRLTLPLETRIQSKSSATMTLGVRPDRVVRNRTRPRIIVRVRADGEPAAGRVLLRGAGQTVVTKLDDRGRAVARFNPIRGLGKKTVRARYLGDDATREAGQRITFRVFRK